jgi:hypothetical protein
MYKRQHKMTKKLLFYTLIHPNVSKWLPAYRVPFYWVPVYNLQGFGYVGHGPTIAVLR